MAESKSHKITLIPGDGIGPKVTQAVVRILQATGVKFEWEQHAARAEDFEISASTSRGRSTNPSNPTRWR